MSALWLIPLCAVLWRFQGGAWFASSLPGRPVWYVIVVLSALSGVLSGWISAAAIGFGLIWASSWPHGRWYTLGRASRDLSGRPPSFFEIITESVCDVETRDDASCLLASKLIAFIPLAIMTAWINSGAPTSFILFMSPAVIVIGYAIGWVLHDMRIIQQPTAFGEIATGGCIGLTISLT